MFVFPGKSGESAALVRRSPLVFAPTVAKTVAIIGPLADREFGLYSLWIGPLYKEAMLETSESADQTHGGSARFKHLAAEAGKDVAEALRDIAVMVVGEAVKRAIWG